MYSFEDKKKENKPSFLSRIKSKREKIISKPLETDNHYKLLNTIRSQMQVESANPLCLMVRTIFHNKLIFKDHVKISHPFLLLFLLNLIMFGTRKGRKGIYEVGLSNELRLQSIQYSNIQS